MVTEETWSSSSAMDQLLLPLILLQMAELAGGGEIGNK